MTLKADTEYRISIQYSCISSFPDRKPGDIGAGVLRIGARLKVENSNLIADAVRLASETDIVVLCLGTDGEKETEGFDRADMRHADPSKCMSHHQRTDGNLIVYHQNKMPLHPPFLRQTLKPLSSTFREVQSRCPGLPKHLLYCNRGF